MMMMIQQRGICHPTVQIPPPWTETYGHSEEEEEEEEEEVASDLYYASDEFRMYEFKIRRCGRGRAHDWTECPYAHPGEKARRRDPRRFHYSGTPCPEYKKGGGCKKSSGCEYAHGVFECWLHPARYRTQPCKDGTACRRRVCFFAHTPDQLRLLSPTTTTLKMPVPDSYDGSPMRRLIMSRMSSSSSSSSPPMSPVGGSSEYGSLSPPADGLAMWMGKMRLQQHQRPPTKREVVVVEEKHEEEEGEPDFAWISDLVK